MEKLCDDIVHKLWMVDHHKNLPDVDMRETFEKVHLSWLRENLNEFGVDSAHIKIEKLREFAIDALLFYGYIYEYNPSPKKCLVPVQNNRIDNLGLSVVPAFKNGSENLKTREFAEETLEKNAIEKI